MLGGLLLLGTIVGLIVLWIRVLRRPGSALPHCRACGYPARGLSTFQCPECGSDLREVGITTGADKALGLGAFLLAWTLLLIFPAALFTQVVLQELAPHRQHVEARLDLRPQSGAGYTVAIQATVTRSGRGHGGYFSTSSGPPTPVGRPAQVVVTMNRWPPGVAPDAVSVELTNAGRTVTLTHDPATDVTRMSGISGQSPGAAPLSAERIRSLFEHTGLDTNDPERRVEAEALHDILTAVAAGLPRFTTDRYAVGRHITGGGTQDAAWGWGMGLFWLVVYAAGIVIFVRRRRRLITPMAHA